MTANTIHMLLDYLPPQSRIEEVQHYQEGSSDDLKDPEVAKFAIIYSDLGVGWKIAQRLADLEMDFPCFVEGHDLWLRNAYLYCLNPDKYGDNTIRHARALAMNVRFTNAINGLLMSPDMDYNSISIELNIPPQVLAAYEKLFFNVIDRHMDHMFIKNVVYPDGRLVETYENYLENEDLGNILKRVGFNNGKDDVLYFAGFRSGLLSSLSEQNMPVKLESVIMANGYLLAKNGWANQREHAAGLTSARNLIAAAKHGGQEQQHDSAFTRYGPTLVAEILQTKNFEAEQRPTLADGIPGAR